MAQWVLTQNYFPLAGRGDADTRGGRWGAERGGGWRTSQLHPSPAGKKDWLQHLNAEGGGKRIWGEKPLRDFRCKNYWEFLQSPLPRWRLTPGPHSLQPTQALRRLPSQITLIALQIASRIRCSFQLNPRLSISTLFGEFKWCAYSYCLPGYGVRKGVAIAHSETKSRSVNLRNQRSNWRSRLETDSCGNRSLGGGWLPLTHPGQCRWGWLVPGPVWGVQTLLCLTTGATNLLLSNKGHPHPRSLCHCYGRHLWGHPAGDTEPQLSTQPSSRNRNVGQAVLRLLPEHQWGDSPSQGAQPQLVVLPVAVHRGVAFSSTA